MTHQFAVGQKVRFTEMETSGSYAYYNNRSRIGIFTVEKVIPVNNPAVEKILGHPEWVRLKEDGGLTSGAILEPV